MSEDWKAEYNASAEKHNKRVKSIREVRLPKSCTAAIDESIKSMDKVHEQICESIHYGFNGLMMDDVINLVTAMHKLKAEFEYRELRS